MPRDKLVRCCGCGEKFKSSLIKTCTRCIKDFCEYCRSQCGHSSEESYKTEWVYLAQMDRLNRQKKGPFAQGRIF